VFLGFVLVVYSILYKDFQCFLEVSVVARTKLITIGMMSIVSIRNKQENIVNRTILYFNNNNNNKMVSYHAHFHARRAQCVDPWTAKRLQTLKQPQKHDLKQRQD
jgi:hypothetical protein